jgi:hypothetical protein
LKTDLFPRKIWITLCADFQKNQLTLKQRWDQINKMEAIELKTKPFPLAIRVFLLVFISTSIFKYLWYGWYFPSDILLFLRARAIESFVATAAFCIVSVIPFFRGCFNIRLTDKTLQAPAARWKSITVNLSDISVNRSLRDRLNGTQVVTTDGEHLQIHSVFYDRKSISNLLDDIERRKINMNHPNPRTHSIADPARSE